VQLFHKAASFDALGKKFVLTIQREFFDYLQNEFQMEQLRPAVATDVFHLHSYSVTLTPGGLSLQMDGQWSTNLVGVEQMLSQGTGEEILEDDVIQRITDRLPRSRGLDEDIPLIVAPVSEDGVKADDQDADEGA
jgi:hypothetical protein